jgi:tetrahydromethanopterin S-methyltransferase subunit F
MLQRLNSGVGVAAITGAVFGVVTAIEPGRFSGS